MEFSAKNSADANIDCVNIKHAAYYHCVSTWRPHVKKIPFIISRWTNICAEVVENCSAALKISWTTKSSLARPLPKHRQVSEGLLLKRRTYWRGSKNGATLQSSSVRCVDGKVTDWPSIGM